MWSIVKPKLMQAVAEDRPFAERLLLAALSCAAPAFTLTIFAPLDILAGNQNEFAFNASAVIGSLLLCFVVLFAGLLCLCLLLRGKLFNIAVSLICMLGLCLYLQGSFLNGNTGILDGSEPRWSGYGRRAYIDTLIWIALLVMPSIVRYFSLQWWKRVVLFASVLALGMQLAALLAVAGKLSASVNDASFLMSKEGQFSLSTKGNVVLFVIDTFDNAYLDAVLAAEPDYLSDFTGFTYYHNNAGVHSRTNPSVPHMLSGKDFRFDTPFYESYLPDVWRGESLPRALSEAGYDVRFYAWDTLFTNEALSCVDNIYAVDASNRQAIYRLDPKPLIEMLLRFAAYRCWPHVLKPVAWVDGEAALRTAKEFSRIPLTNDAFFVVDDFQFYDNLRETGISADCEKPAFRYYHFRGTHHPYDMNENTERVPASPDYDIRQPAKGEINIVRTYLEQMRSEGIYDSSLIIVTADHGRVEDDYMAQGDPVLMIKPANASGVFAISEAPTSLMDIGATILDQLGIPSALPGVPVHQLTEETERERFFYMTMYDINGNDQEMIEYRIGQNVNDRRDWTPTGNSWPATYPCY